MRLRSRKVQFAPGFTANRIDGVLAARSDRMCFLRGRISPTSELLLWSVQPVKANRVANADKSAELALRKAAQRLLLIIVGLQHGIDLRDMEQFANIATGVEELECFPISYCVRITAHQQSQPGTVDPADAAEIDKDIGIFLFKYALRQSGQLCGPASQLYRASELEDRNLSRIPAIDSLLTQALGQQLANAQFFKARIASQVMAFKRFGGRRVESLVQVLDNQFFPEQWLVVKWHDDLYLSDFQQPTVSGLHGKFYEICPSPGTAPPETGRQ